MEYVEILIGLLEQWRKERGYQVIALDEEDTKDDLKAYLKEHLYQHN